MDTKLIPEEQKLTPRQREVLQLLSKRQVHEGSWRGTEHDSPHGSISQIQDDGSAQRKDERGIDPVRDQKSSDCRLNYGQRKALVGDSRHHDSLKYEGYYQ